MKKIKNWLKDNRFKLTVIILLSLIVITGFYFYKNKKENYYLQQAQKCMEFGNKYVKEQYNNDKFFSEEIVPQKTEYHFNKKLNTCLVYIEEVRIFFPDTIDNELNRDNKYVVDILANKVLIQNSIKIFGAAYNKDESRIEFEKQKQILMNE